MEGGRGGRFFDFQLIILRFEGGGGLGRLDSAVGGVRKGGKRALAARGGRESMAPLFGGARRGGLAK